ncbi:MAG: hypothetical protein GY874_13700 [Desulfobacteraceae bacterium]|nr:hypothetical protein [Desulfobacteraceae bacterium]
MKKLFIITVTVTVLLTSSIAFADFALMGVGGCRYSNGTGDDYDRYYISWSECRAICATNADCLGIEFSLYHNYSSCEIHYQTIAYSSGSVGSDAVTTCWRKK